MEDEETGERERGTLLLPGLSLGGPGMVVSEVDHVVLKSKGVQTIDINS